METSYSLIRNEWKHLKNSIQKLLESDDAISLPILLFDDVSQYGESTGYGENGN